MSTLGLGGFDFASGNDIDKLLKFIEWVEKDIERLFERYPKLVPEHPELIQQFTSSWKDAKNHLRELRNYLIDSDSAVKNELILHGLTGNHLDVKLRAVAIVRAQNAIAEQIHDQLLKQKEMEYDLEKRKWYDPLIDPFRRLERYLKGKLLDIFCGVLGSLSEAGIPFAGLINELKDVIRSATEEK